MATGDGLKPLVVAVDATALLGVRTGVGTFVSGALGALADRDDVLLIGYGLTWAGRRRLPAVLPSGVSACRLPMAAGPLMRLWRQMDAPVVEWWTGRIDVVHGTNFVVPPARRAAQVVTVHDLTPIRFPALCTPTSRGYPALVRRALARGAMVHTPSDAVAAEVIATFGVGPERVRTVPHGLAIGPPPRSAEGSPRAGGQPYVLALGTVEPRKDLPTLVKAFDAVASLHPDLRLVVAGPVGWGEGALTDAIGASRAQARIDRVGWVSDAERAILLRDAAAFAFPSRYEGFGFPPLEAMAAGVPVVATAAGAVPEVVGDAALMVDVGDSDALAAALIRVLDDQDERARLVTAGRERVTHFSWERCAQGLVSLYRDRDRRWGMTLRVALNVEQLLYRAPGGIGRYTARLVSLLPVVAGDVEVVPFTARHAAADVAAAYRAFGLDDGAAAAPVRLAWPRPLLYDCWHVAAWPRLGWLSRSLGRCPLIHAPSLAVPPKGRARLVVTVHDVAPLVFPEAFTARGRRFHQAGLRAAAARADLVIAVSQASAGEIAEYTSIAADRVRVVPNGVDQVQVTAAEVAAGVASWGLGDAPYVLWIGSLEPRKDVGTLVRAFALAVQDGGLPHRLALAGPAGWLDGGLVPEAERDKLGDRLRLLGPVGHRELPALYAGADLFAFPSRHEGFGLPVLEAMAQGTPVVCADIPALREVTAGAARLVPPGDVAAWADAMVTTLADDGERAAMVAAGRRRAAELSWERTARATRAAYDAALA